MIDNDMLDQRIAKNQANIGNISGGNPVIPLKNLIKLRTNLTFKVIYMEEIRMSETKQIPSILQLHMIKTLPMP